MKSETSMGRPLYCCYLKSSLDSSTNRGKCKQMGLASFLYSSRPFHQSTTVTYLLCLWRWGLTCSWGCLSSSAGIVSVCHHTQCTDCFCAGCASLSCSSNSIQSACFSVQNQPEPVPSRVWGPTGGFPCFPTLVNTPALWSLDSVPPSSFKQKV